MGSSTKEMVHNHQEITWADMWRTPQARLSFRIRAMYNLLPCPSGMAQRNSASSATSPIQHWSISSVAACQHCHRAGTDGNMTRSCTSWQKYWKLTGWKQIRPAHLQLQLDPVRQARERSAVLHQDWVIPPNLRRGEAACGRPRPPAKNSLQRSPRH